MNLTNLLNRIGVISLLTLFGARTIAQTNQYDITSYGAVKNSEKICTKAVQAAIDACYANGGGEVVVPTGTFTCGTIHLKSNVNLHLNGGAVLQGSKNLNDYEVNIPEKPYAPNHKGLLFTEDADNVSITGEGQIDGNGDSYFDMTVAKTFDPAAVAYTRQKSNFRRVESGIGVGPVVPHDRPYQMILFSNCTRVTVKDVFITKSPFWCMHFADCDAVHVYGVRLWTNMLAPNADGIDVTSCSNVIIDGCDIRAGDDALNIVGFSHHYEVPGFRRLKHFAGNIIISNCNLQSNSSALRIGYEDQNSLENVRVSNVNITNSSRGVGIFLRDEGSLKNITFTNMYIQTHMPTGDWWGNGEPIHISAIHGNNDKPLGTIENVQFNNIICKSDAGIVVYGTSESIIKNVSFKNISFELVDTKLNDIAGGNIDLRGARGTKNQLFARDIPAFLVENIDGLTIDDFKLTWTNPRMPFLTNGIELHNFKNVKINRFQGTGAPNNPGTFPLKAEDGEGLQTDLKKSQVQLINVK
ncbi:MAG: glycoside hydrolase family 28 protein [Mucilaginibacter sp.]